ncbi:MBL fold metallo-hydrolase [Pirellulaceae bacterium SH467]|jgi:metallo-beta-lactamase family protein
MDRSSFNPQPSATLQFLGATDSVTGSMHLLDTGSYRLLLDCGNESSEDERGRKKPFRWHFEPASIDAVCITHAHQDHCGGLPLLVRDGFRGPILCSHATYDLLDVILSDRAHYFERSAFRRTSFRSRGWQEDESTTFTYADVENTLRLCTPLPLGEPFRLGPTVSVQLSDSGHVLGSVSFQVEFRSEERWKRVLFTGDLGRSDLPLVGNLSPLPSADAIVCESTYGGKQHESYPSTIDKLSTIIRHTVARGGKVLIPAFSLGRIHLVMHTLQSAKQDGRIPNCPIYIDSPLAKRLDDVYHEHLGDEALRSLAGNWISDSDEAWYRSTQPGSSIIIASGGMCDSGRILDHLRYHIDDPRSSLIMVSYQAPESFGATLLSPTPVVRFKGRVWNKWIDIHQVSGFSAHADQNDLLRVLSSTASETKNLFLIHGESEQKVALKQRCQEIGFRNVFIPAHGQAFPI